MRNREKDRLYYIANADRIKARVKQWQEKNPDKRKAWIKSWKARNQDKVRSQKLKNRYGITEDAYSSILLDQGGVCAICDSPPNGKALAVDHDHRTGKVRGILCFRCNAAIGYMDDTPDRLRKTACYLEKHQ